MQKKNLLQTRLKCSWYPITNSRSCYKKKLLMMFLCKFCMEKQNVIRDNLRTFKRFLMLDFFSVGVRTRSRNLLREAVRPHGQCLSDLKQSEACNLQACYTYTSSSVTPMASEAVEDSSADDSVKCIRSDGLIVEGKNEGCFHKIQDEHGFGIIMYAIQSFFCTFNFLILEVIGALRLGGQQRA